MRLLKWTSFFLKICAAVCLTGCGYRTDEKETTLSLSHIKGDSSGILTQTLIRALATSGTFRYQNQKGRLLVEGAIISDTDAFIGYQFDQDPLSGKQIHRLVPNEGRREVTVEITLIDARTRQVLHGPIQVSAFADYDFIDSESLKETSFINEKGFSESALFFSRGQLDSMSGAQRACLSPIYQALATKIVEGISHLSYDLE